MDNFQISIRIGEVVHKPFSAATVWRYVTENVAQPFLSTVGASYSKAKKLLLYSPRDVAAAAARRFRAGWLHDFGSPSMGVGCENKQLLKFADVGAVWHLDDVVALSDAGEAGVVQLNDGFRVDVSTWRCGKQRRRASKAHHFRIRNASDLSTWRMDFNEQKRRHPGHPHRGDARAF